MNHFPFCGPTQSTVPDRMDGWDEGRMVEVAYGELFKASRHSPHVCPPSSGLYKSQPSNIQTLALAVKPARGASYETVELLRLWCPLSHWYCGTTGPCLPCSWVVCYQWLPIIVPVFDGSGDRMNLELHAQPYYFRFVDKERWMSRDMACIQAVSVAVTLEISTKRNSWRHIMCHFP